MSSAVERFALDTISQQWLAYVKFTKSKGHYCVPLRDYCRKFCSDTQLDLIDVEAAVVRAGGPDAAQTRNDY